MRINGQLRRVLGAFLVFATALPAGGAFGAPAPAGATIQGLVLTVPAASDAPRRPVAGAVVRALDVASGKSWQSGESGSDGSYHLEGLPAGQFAVAVETKAGVFLGDGLVGLEPGQQRRLSFSLRAEKAEGEGGSATPPSGDKGTPPQSGGNKGWWASHPWLGGAVVVGTAVALGVIADQLTNENKNKETNASPSAP